MYDTYQEAEDELSEESSGSDVQDTEMHKLDDLSSVDSYRVSSDEKQLSKLFKNLKFLEAVCVMERLLANNCYNEQQKRFIGLSDPGAFRENIEYKYNLDLLWTFANSDTKGTNSFNQLLLLADVESKLRQKATIFLGLLIFFHGNPNLAGKSLLTTIETIVCYLSS